MWLPAPTKWATYHLPNMGPPPHKLVRGEPSLCLCLFSDRILLRDPTCLSTQGAKNFPNKVQQDGSVSNGDHQQGNLSSSPRPSWWKARTNPQVVLWPQLIHDITKAPILSLSTISTTSFLLQRTSHFSVPLEPWVLRTQKMALKLGRAHLRDELPSGDSHASVTAFSHPHWPLGLSGHLSSLDWVRLTTE